jgi:hypothetical protein
MTNSEFNPGFLGMDSSHGFWRGAGLCAAQGLAARGPQTSSKAQPGPTARGLSSVRQWGCALARCAASRENASFQKEKSRRQCGAGFTYIVRAYAA